VENNTLVLVEVINGQSLSSGPITYETKALDVTILFNVISSSKNLVVIGLFWFVLHNPQMDWHTRNFHFETPQHEALECEAFVG
jgi:hypothetical protein